MKRNPHLMSLAIGMALIASSDAWATVDVLLRERVVAASPVVRLGEVAQITSADRRKARQLSVLILMPAPAPGTDRFLRRREVEDLLAAHGEDLAELRLDGAAQIQVITPAANPIGKSHAPNVDGSGAQPVNRHAEILAKYLDGNPAAVPARTSSSSGGNKVQEIIKRYLEAKTGQTGNWQVACKLGARESLALEAALGPPTCTGGGEPWTGRQRFILTVVTSAGEVNLPVYADIVAPLVPVAVAIRPIQRGAIITAADVEMQTVDASTPSARRAPVSSVEQLIGMEARQAIPAGDVILSDKLQAPLLIKRGDLVTVISQGGGIRVRTTARARQDGAKGELVKVESLETRAQYDVRVTGHREAAIFVAARTSAITPNLERINTARR